MKKWFRLFAALCLAAVLCVPLAACERGSESGGTENGGSENGGNTGDPSAVRTTVTEEEWNAAVYGDLVNSGIDGFLYDPDANVTIVSTASMTSENGEVEKYRIEVQIDGNKRYYKLNMEQTVGAESEKMTQDGYMEILSYPEDGEGIFVMNVYSKDENGVWTVERQESTLGTDDESIAISPYEQVLAFENFTYNASLRQYEAKDLVFDYGEVLEEEFGEEFYGELIYTFELFTFRFENGKLIYREEQGKVEADGFVGSYVGDVTYSYGTASVTLPVVGE